MSKSWKNKHLGADIHDPKAPMSTTPRDFQKLRPEKLWAEFSFPRPCDLPWDGMGRWRGIDQDQLLSNSVYKILPWRFRAVFLLSRARAKSGWLEVDQELGMGCQLLTNCRRLSCGGPLATPDLLRFHPPSGGGGQGFLGRMGVEGEGPPSDT